MQKITILLFGLAALFCPNVAAIAIDPAHAVIVTTNTTTRKAVEELRRHVQSHHRRGDVQSCLGRVRRHQKRECATERSGISQDRLRKGRCHQRKNGNQSIKHAQFPLFEVSETAKGRSTVTKRWSRTGIGARTDTVVAG